MSDTYESYKRLALYVVVTAVADLHGEDGPQSVVGLSRDSLRDSAFEFFYGPEEESNIGLFLDVLGIDVSSGIPSPGKMAEIIMDLGYADVNYARPPVGH